MSNVFIRNVEKCHKKIVKANPTKLINYLIDNKKIIISNYRLRIVNNVRTKVMEIGEIYIPDLTPTGQC